MMVDVVTASSSLLSAVASMLLSTPERPVSKQHLFLSALSFAFSAVFNCNRSCTLALDFSCPAPASVPGQTLLSIEPSFRFGQAEKAAQCLSHNLTPISQAVPVKLPTCLPALTRPRRHLVELHLIEVHTMLLASCLCFVHPLRLETWDR